MAAAYIGMLMAWSRARGTKDSLAGLIGAVVM
jgi:hypothetical protein